MASSKWLQNFSNSKGSTFWSWSVAKSCSRVNPQERNPSPLRHLSINVCFSSVMVEVERSFLCFHLGLHLLNASPQHLTSVSCYPGQGKGFWYGVCDFRARHLQLIESAMRCCRMQLMPWGPGRPIHPTTDVCRREVAFETEMHRKNDVQIKILWGCSKITQEVRGSECGIDFWTNLVYNN